MGNVFRKILENVLGHTPWKWVIENHLIRQWRLLIVNWIFQRLFGINSDVPWTVNFTSRVTNPDKIELGQFVIRSMAISGGCYFQGGNGILIGDRTIIAPGVKVISANHGVTNLGRNWEAGEPIKIGSDCWIGANAVILPEVCLGDRVIVGAGSVVTKSFPSDSVIAGVPAKTIRRLKCGLKE
jgi:acetyltransferase-like isoleucine patch superfamily enzyme